MRIFLLVCCIFVFLLIFISVLYVNEKVNSQRQYMLYAKVLKVIDGDTFEVYVLNTSRVERLRLKCIDFPDLAPQERVNKWLFKYHVKNMSILIRCYHESISLLKEMLENKSIIILQDKKYERDKYHRLLGYVIFNGTDINDFLIENGYAIPYLCDKYAPSFDREGCLWIE